MVSIDEFCDRLMGGFSAYFEQRQALRLITQSKASCKAIVKTCLHIEPDYVLEIGTNYGLSTLSLAYALKLLGKDLSALTTTDIELGHWLNETPGIQRALLLNAEIDLSHIQAVRGDFILMPPQRMVRPGKVLVFYDIHDTATVSYMEKFIAEWIPLFDHGYVMVHDCYLPKTAYWIDRNNPDLPVSSATHFSGLSLEGYKECKVLVDWLNAGHRAIRALPGTSIVRFAI
jgi:hypothetical protein